jgi:hypothetical protein
MPSATVGQLSRLEAVLGSKGRSNYQLGIWEAAYGPVGPDGYPKPLWDKLTGKIDRSVAEYMRENGYDLTEYARRNWPALGPKIDGKLVMIAGDMDNFHLNLGVYDFEDMVRTWSGLSPRRTSRSPSTTGDRRRATATITWISPR